MTQSVMLEILYRLTQPTQKHTAGSVFRLTWHFKEVSPNNDVVVLVILVTGITCLNKLNLEHQSGKLSFKRLKLLCGTLKVYAA